MANESRPDSVEKGTPSELLLGAGLCLLALTWAYWPTFGGLVQHWSDNPQMSHGFLVPFIAALVLWYRWDYRPKAAPQANLWGLVVLAGAGGMRFLGAYLNYEWLDEASFVVALVGCVLLLLGLSWLLWASWGLVLLMFMIPLPFAVQNGLAGTLQRVATIAATYLLQTFGYPAVSESNTIVINKTRLGVLEACNGLGMLQSFVLLSVAMAMISRRVVAERLVLLACGIPIALLANLTRITVTAILTIHTSDPTVHERIHDVSGWLMLPLALLLLWLITKMMDNLWIETPLVPSSPLASQHPAARPNPN